MLKVEKVTWQTPPTIDDDGESLLRRNPQILFTVSAPIFWWLDTNFRFATHSLIENKNFSDLVFDEWAPHEKIIQELSLEIQKEQSKISIFEVASKQFRRTLEILPLGTMVQGKIILSYKDVIKYVEDYLDESLFSVDFLPTRREWSDFCETLLDLRGVRTYVKEEELRGDA